MFSGVRRWNISITKSTEILLVACPFACADSRIRRDLSRLIGILLELGDTSHGTVSSVDHEQRAAAEAAAAEEIAEALIAKVIISSRAHAHVSDVCMLLHVRPRAPYAYSCLRVRFTCVSCVRACVSCQVLRGDGESVEPMHCDLAGGTWPEVRSGDAKADAHHSIRSPGPQAISSISSTAASRSSSPLERDAAVASQHSHQIATGQLVVKSSPPPGGSGGGGTAGVEVQMAAVPKAETASAAAMAAPCDSFKPHGGGSKAVAGGGKVARGEGGVGRGGKAAVVGIGGQLRGRGQDKIGAAIALRQALTAMGQPHTPPSPSLPLALC